LLKFSSIFGIGFEDNSAFNWIRESLTFSETSQTDFIKKPGMMSTTGFPNVCAAAWDISSILSNLD